MELKKPITLNRTESNITEGSRPDATSLYRGEPYFDGFNLWISSDETAESERQVYSFDNKTPIAGKDANPDIHDTRNPNPQYKLEKNKADNYIGGLKVPTLSNNEWKWTKQGGAAVKFEGIGLDTSAIANCTASSLTILNSNISSSVVTSCTIKGSEDITASDDSNATKINTCYLKISGNNNTPLTVTEGKTYFSINDATSTPDMMLFRVEDMRTYFGSTPINLGAGIGKSLIGTDFPTSPTPTRGDIFLKVPGTTSAGEWKQATLYVRT